MRVRCRRRGLLWNVVWWSLKVHRTATSCEPYLEVLRVSLEECLSLGYRDGHALYVRSQPYHHRRDGRAQGLEVADESGDIRLIVQGEVLERLNSLGPESEEGQQVGRTGSQRQHKGRVRGGGLYVHRRWVGRVCEGAAVFERVVGDVEGGESGSLIDDVVHLRMRLHARKEESQGRSEYLQL